jgi:hypothetical protein
METTNTTTTKTHTYTTNSVMTQTIKNDCVNFEMKKKEVTITVNDIKVKDVIDFLELNYTNMFTVDCTKTYTNEVVDIENVKNDKIVDLDDIYINENTKEIQKQKIENNVCVINSKIIQIVSTVNNYNTVNINFTKTTKKQIRKIQDNIVNYLLEKSVVVTEEEKDTFFNVNVEKTLYVKFVDDIFCNFLRENEMINYAFDYNFSKNEFLSTTVKLNTFEELNKFIKKHKIKDVKYIHFGYQFDSLQKCMRHILNKSKINEIQDPILVKYLDYNLKQVL